MSDSRDRALTALYDWMADELVTIANEMAAETIGTESGRQLVRGTALSVAQFVSHSRGSGKVDVLDHL